MHKNLSPQNPECSSCQAFLPSLSFVMQDFMIWVWKNYPDMHIAQGFRSEADQHADFLAGKSHLDFPRSAHNNLKDGQPFSEAVDLFQLLPNGQAAFPVSRYQDLYSAAMGASQNITWGGSWSSLKDYDHLQNSDWSAPE